MVFLENPYGMTHTALLKNTIENVMDLMVIMGNVLVLMETTMVFTGV